MANKLRPAIERHFNFSDYPEAAPEMEELLLHHQRELVAAYLRDYPSEFCELMESLDGNENYTVAGMIDGTIDDDSRADFDEVLADAGLKVFALGINQRIEDMWELYCRDFGKFDADSDHEPGSLRGFAA